MNFYDGVSGSYFVKSDEAVIKFIKLWSKGLIVKNKVNAKNWERIIYGSIECDNALKLYLDFLPMEVKSIHIEDYCENVYGIMNVNDHIYFAITLEADEPCIYINLHPIYG